ncbi:MAG: DUF367 family protein [Saccharolobus sp.]
MQVFVIEFEQDDPKKCTAKKMIRLGLAERVRKPFGIILNPISERVLSFDDKDIIRNIGITVIDSSWNKSDMKLFSRYNNKLARRLPILFAGNPINYAKPYKLSSLEAVAASLFIICEKDLGLKLLSIIKWGHTFYELNKELFEMYCGKSEKEILKLEEQIIEYLRGP